MLISTCFILVSRARDVALQLLPCQRLDWMTVLLHENEGDFSDSDSSEAIEEGGVPIMGSTVGSNSSKQSREFLTEWLACRTRQLADDRKRQGMLCVLCQKHDHNGDDSTWAPGVKNTQTS